jgi:ATP-dependent Clp protease ATP-binding subunit ClpA
VPSVPKINVYLPDDLAEAVREARIPVSAVCQRALEDALRHSTAASESTRALEEAGETDVPVRGPTTPRLRKAVQLAYAAARERKVNYVGTEHLLLGILDERDNLAVRVVVALEVEPDDVRRELDALIAQHQVKPTKGVSLTMTPLARRAFELASEESVRLMHNYVGCEHLLLGLVGEEDGLAGRVLRSMGLDRTVTRRATVTALTGFVHARREVRAPAESNPLTREILDRLAAIESRIDAPRA